MTGQDGSYLAELFLAKGYEVHGIIRGASTFNTERIDHLYQDPHINDVQLSCGEMGHPHANFCMSKMQQSCGFKLIVTAYGRSHSLDIKSMQMLVISAAKFFHLVCLL
jgi:hypothetical protein